MGPSQPGSAFEIERLGFFCVAPRRETAGTVGLLDEALDPGFYEDDDDCLRVRDGVPARLPGGCVRLPPGDLFVREGARKTQETAEEKPPPP